MFHCKVIIIFFLPFLFCAPSHYSEWEGFPLIKCGISKYVNCLKFFWRGDGTFSLFIYLFIQLFVSVETHEIILCFALYCNATLFNLLLSLFQLYLFVVFHQAPWHSSVLGIGDEAVCIVFGTLLVSGAHHKFILCIFCTNLRTSYYCLLLWRMLLEY